jgi:translation elongation factor EF-G
VHSINPCAKLTLVDIKTIKTGKKMNINEDSLNMSVRKFLKKVGITSQREIEKAIHEAVEAGTISGNTLTEVSVTLDLGDLAEPVVIRGEIEVEFTES